MGPLGELTSSFPVPKDPGPALKTNMGSVLAEASSVPTHRPKTCRKFGSGNNCTVHSSGNRQVRRQRVLLVQLRGSASAGKPPASSPPSSQGAPPHSPFAGYSGLDPGPRPTAAGSSCKSTNDAPRAIGRLNCACPLAAVRPTRPMILRSYWSSY